MIRHVVTGGNGFVGQRLLQSLRSAGEDVLVFDTTAPPPGVTGIVGDVRDRAALARLALGEGDIVYHLAARQFHLDVPGRGRDDWFADVNVRGTAALLDEMIRGGARQLVFFSTDMTYGRPEAHPVSPAHVQAPIGPYGRSKLAAEKLIIEAVAAKKVNATIFRPRLIAGAGRLGILARLFALIDKGLPVPMIGNGRNRYQMIAVEDCVSAARRAVELGCPTGPFNLGSENPPTVKELLSTLSRRAGSKSVPLPVPARPLQALLAVLDTLGMTLLYPEQYAIADADYVLDTTATAQALVWGPTRRDEDILWEAFCEYRSRLAGGGTSALPAHTGKAVG